MSDRLAITDLEVWTRIGLTKEERAQEQRLLISVIVNLNSASPHKDDLEQSVDYAEIAGKIRSITQAKERRTMEGLAEELATMILSTFRVKSVGVTVKKFALPGIAHASFTIERP